MKELDLLKAIGAARPEYIEEAALTGPRKRNRSRAPWAAALAASLVLVLGAFLLTFRDGDFHLRPAFPEAAETTEAPVTEEPSVTEEPTQPETEQTLPEITDPIQAAYTAFAQVLDGQALLLPEGGSLADPRQTLEQLIADWTEDGPQDLRFTLGTLVDLEQDGVPELVLRDTSVHALGYLILCWEDGEVWGYSRYYRAMISLYADGAYSWSGSAFTNGISRAQLHQGSWQEVSLVYQEAEADGVTRFYQNGQPVTEESYQQALARQEETSMAQWILTRDLPAYLLGPVRESWQARIAPALPPEAVQQIRSLVEQALPEIAQLEAAASAAVTQGDMNVAAGTVAQGWDDLLNDIWSILARELPEEVYQPLLAEQRSWIAEKEGALTAERESWDGGSIAPLMVNSLAENYTRGRVWTLLAYAGIDDAFDLLAP